MKKNKIIATVLYLSVTALIAIVYSNNFLNMAVNSGESSLALVGVGGVQSPKYAGSASSKCTIIALNGINSDGSFGIAVKELAKKYPSTTVTTNSFDSAKDAGNYIKQVIPSTKRSNPNSKILAAVHSISAIGTFNVMSSLKTKADFLLYDPPYNYPYTNGLSGVFNSNAKEIRTARNNNIAKAPEITDWTKGLATPLEDHEMYKYDSNALSRISDWLTQNCAEAKPATLTLTCYPSTGTAVVGSPVYFTANANGGIKTKTHSWKEDSTEFDTKAVTLPKSFTTPGTKKITVTVESGDQTKTASCPVVIVPSQTTSPTTPTPPTIPTIPTTPPVTQTSSSTYSVICYGYFIPQGSDGHNGEVSYAASIYGTTGPTWTYEWSEGGVPFGNNWYISSKSGATKYTTPGTKTVNVTVRSGNMSSSASCSVTLPTPVI